MTDSITPRQFHDADGVDDWRMLDMSVAARFDTGSVARGVELARGISAAAAPLGVRADPTALQDVPRSPTNTPRPGGDSPTPRATRSTVATGTGRD